MREKNTFASLAEKEAFYSIKLHNRTRRRLMKPAEVTTHFHCRMRPEYKKIIVAYALYKSTLSQRQILEAALDLYFEQHKEELQKALIFHEQRG